MSSYSEIDIQRVKVVEAKREREEKKYKKRVRMKGKHVTETRQTDGEREKVISIQLAILLAASVWRR